MQLLTTASEPASPPPSEVSSDECARQLLNVAPRVVRAIRRLMRDHRLADLSVPQFRALALLSFCPKASLSTLADYVGTSLPAASRMVDGLVSRRLVARKSAAMIDAKSPSLSPRARGAFRISRQATQKQLSKQLSPLSAAQRHAVVEAMQLLSGIYGADPDIKSNGQHEIPNPPAAAVRP